VHAHIHPSSARFTARLAQGAVSTVDQALRPVMVSSCGRSLYREPLRPRAGVTSSQHGIPTRVARHYTRLSRSYGLMRQTEILSQSRCYPRAMSLLQVAAYPCWKSALPSVISANLSLDAWTHTPAASAGAHTRFFPGNNGLHHTGSGSADRKISARQLLYGVASRGCSHSLMFRPPDLLATQVAPTASRSAPVRAAVASTSTPISVCYLPEQWIC